MKLYYVPLEEFARARRAALSEEQGAALFATLCRINVLYMIMRAGSGHIGTSFSCMDILSWLFLRELRFPTEGDRTGARDTYFSSKGHDAPALYSILTALGHVEFDLIHKLRRIGGLPGHPDISTPFIEANTGSLGMGISKAKGMALANRLLGRDGWLYVLTGDGELQEGQIWESLPSAANRDLAELVVIVDHNKVQSDTFVTAVSDLGDLEAKLRAFGWHVGRCNGHVFGDLASGISQAKLATDKPKVIIADTIKGRGVSFMEHTSMAPGEKLYRYHSGAPTVEAYAKAAEELIVSANTLLRQARVPELRLASSLVTRRPRDETQQRLIPAYSKELVRQAERHSRLVVLDADLALDCGLLPFQEKFPHRFFECGIAEQDMVSQAGGMALRGLLPVVHSFASFLSTRPNEQIYNNATERTKIVYVASLAGLLPGGPGHSHQALRDIAALAAIPGLIVLEACNEAEVRMAVDFCVNGTGESCYLRLVSVPCEIPYELPTGYRLELGRGVALMDGREAIVFGYGPILLAQAYRAADLLRQEHGISVRIVNLPWLNRLDAAWLQAAVAGFKWAFTLDNHYLLGGQGDLILSTLSQLPVRSSIQAHKLGVSGLPASGGNEEVLNTHGLDARSICDAILRRMGCHSR